MPLWEKLSFARIEELLRIKISASPNFMKMSVVTHLVLGSNLMY